jgi:hypothetical protein
MSLDINIDTHTNQRSGIPNSIAMLRLPILTSHFSKSIPFTSFTAHSTLRAGLKLQTPRIKPRRLANMSTQSKACCTVPPVVSEGYKEKGEWITINGMKTYATGPKEAKSALLVVYDIFGFFPQTLQGADILAHSDKDHQYQLFMPGKLCFPGFFYNRERSFPSVRGRHPLNTDCVP